MYDSNIQAKGDPFSLQQHPVMFTACSTRKIFMSTSFLNREIFIWAPERESFSFRSPAEHSFFYFRHFLSYLLLKMVSSVVRVIKSYRKSKQAPYQKREKADSKNMFVQFILSFDLTSVWVAKIYAGLF